MRHIKKDIFILLLILGGFYLLTSLARPFSNPDEGRYVEIPREMLESGDWVLPRLNGVFFFEKPPLFYWLEAMVLQVFGLSFGSARLLNGVLALIGCVAVYLTARRLYRDPTDAKDAFGRAAGWAAGLGLGSMMLYFALSQIITLDVLTCTTLTLTLCFFILGMLEPAGRLRFWLAMGAYASMGLAVLSKGLIGIAFPGIIALLWFTLTWQWKRLSPLYLLPGLALFCAISLPWHLIAAARNPDFLFFYFVHEQILRYLTPIHNRMQPFWFPGAVFLLGFFPSLVFLPQAIKEFVGTGWARIRSDYPERLFFLCWVFTIVGFYSFSKSKLITYILPAYPGAALFMAPFFAKAWRQPKLLSLGATTVAFAAVCLVGAFVIPVAVWLRHNRMDAEALPVFGALMVFLLCSALFFWKQRDQPPVRGALVHPLIFMAMCVLFFNPLARWVQAPSTQKLAQTIQSISEEGDSVFVFRHYFQDLPVYLKTCVGVVDNRNHELMFGFERQKEEAARAPDLDTFIERWVSDPHLFLVVQKRDFKDLVENYPHLRFPIVDAEGPLLLVCNKSGALASGGKGPVP